ncbi:putative ribonuclease H-like domain-containing protein [Tanacetum coccineum]
MVLNSPCFTVKSWLVQDQTVPVQKQTAFGKDKSNPLIVDSLLKTIRLSIHLVVYNEELAIPEQTATGKGISNPLMADLEEELAPTGETSALPAPKTAKQLAAKRNQERVKSILLLSIPDEYLLKFHNVADAKSLWEAIKSRFGGNEESKKMQKNVLKHQFENFSTASNESLDKAYDRFQKLISQLEVHGAPISKEDINQKFLRSLPPSWNQIALIMRNKPDIDEIDIDDLYNNLRVYEDEMKRSSSSTSTSQNLAFLSSENTSSTNEVSTASGDFGVSTAGGISQVSSTPCAHDVACSFFAQPTTSPQLENEDFQQIDEDDLEELDLRWQVAMLTVRCYNCHRKGHFARECRSGRNQGKRSYGDNGRSNAPTNESSSQALVAQDGLGGYDWSNDFEIEPVNYALMAISSSSSSSSSDNEVQKCSKQCLESFKTLQKNYDSEREKHSRARLEIQGYELALESLESRILVHEKNELAWGEKYEFQNYELKCKEIKINNLNLKLEKVVKERDELKISLSVFYVRTSDEESIPANDRFSKADGYHVVLPPITGNFLTPRANISFAGKTNEANIQKPKTVYESVNRDKVIIEDWNSDDEDDVSEVQTVSPVKTNDKISQTFKKAGIGFKKIKACFVYELNFKLLDESQVVLRAPRKDDVYSLDLKNIVPSGGKSPSISFMRPFGCPLTILNTLDSLGKFDGKSDEGYLLGYSMASKAFRVYNKRTKRVEENLHIDFLKDQPNVAGTGPNWMFDLDFLTNSMNYIPVSVENQVNVDAGTQDSYVAGSSGKDKEPTQEYILLPLHPHRTRIPVEDVAAAHEKPFESSPKDNDVQDSEDATSFNKLSTGRSSVSTATMPYVSAASTPTGANAGESSFFYLGGKIPIDASTLPNADLPIDPNIPDLKDDSDAFQIMAYSIEPMMMRIIHTDHPKDQILEIISQQFKQEEIFKRFLQHNKPCAFLYGTIKEDVYVHQPPGFVDPAHPNKVYKVIKALYSLHQAPRAWYETLSSFLMENGFSREFEDCMHKRFQMSSMGELTFFLGLQVKQQPDGIFISQDKYVADILKKFDFWSIRTATTPIESNKPLVKDEDGEDVDVHVYRSMIGSLMYLTASRLDIMFAICACARFQVTAKASHLNAVKRIFRYLKHQPKLGLWYTRDSPFELEAFLDSDYGGASLDRKSTTSGCQFLGRRLISWQCKKQTIMANSTTEAEYVAAANCCGQVLWIQNQMMDYGFNFMNTRIHIDNESTISVIKNLVAHSRTKHIEIRFHFIRDCYEKRLVKVIKIRTDSNVVGLLTKGFDVIRFNFLVVSIGMLNL